MKQMGRAAGGAVLALVLAGLVVAAKPTSEVNKPAAKPFKPRRWGGVYGAHAPAPPVKPTEPQTRTLTPTEAAAVLEKDWIFQAEGRGLAQRARQEIAWARDLAKRLGKDPRTPSLAAELRELKLLEQRYGIAAATPPRRGEPAGRPVPAGFKLPDGLIARWTFDGPKGERIKPSVGQGRINQLKGRAEFVGGIFGSAIDLNGAAIIHTGRRLASIAKGNYTITAWIKTTSNEADILGNGTAKGHFLLMSYRGVVRGHHWTDRSGNVVDGKTTVNDGRWHHVAQVVDDKQISVFVDGKVDAAMKFVGTKSVAPVSPVTIGGRGLGTGASRFTGPLDEVCVFDRPLSQKQIKSVYDASKLPEGKNPPVPAVDAKGRELYLAVRRVKRRIMLKNPVVDFTQVLFVDNPYPQGREWPHQARHRDGMMAVPGGRLLVLDGLNPGGKIRKLAFPRPGSFWRPDLSFDARKVLFCCKPHDEKSFHLYEINIDGTGLKQLTSGDYDDTDPIYLPGGKIIFTTTRCNTYVRCMPYTYSYILARCDADGGNVYIISRNNEPDWCPALLNDGRVIYSRWEYHDKALWRIQSLWTVNQDGTNVATFWGNQSVWPDHLAEARPIPGSSRVMFTGLAHHDWFAGSIGILDPRKGYNFPQGLTKVTAEMPWPECGRPPLDPIESPGYHSAGRFGAYKTPYPLSEKDFLVSARAPGRVAKFRLYLMDTCGNRELIYEGAYNVWHAMPVKPRRRPPAHADRVAWPGTGKNRQPPKAGVLYSNNVYDGAPKSLAGKIRYVRVIQMDARTYSLWSRDFRHEGPAVSVVQSDGVRRILGTAPVAKDGSFQFKVTAGAALHFQVLDEHYRCLQSMRSFVGVMPGERRGCVGCHELHSTSPANQKGLATRQLPVELTPPPWGTRSISYPRMVQPILDKYCGKCHQGDGKGRKKLDLTFRGGGVFRQPYLTLVGPLGYGRIKKKDAPRGIAGAYMCENYAHSDPDSYRTSPPMTYFSYTSKLIDIASSGKHNKVRLDPVSLRTLIGWVDANCPYRGDEDIRAIPDPTFAGVQDLPIRPRCKTAPVIPRP